MITYKKRRHWKYTLEQDIEYETGLVRIKIASLMCLKLWGSGKLSIFEGYSWDGASFIARDTKTFMRASLIHDALYQLIREGVLPQSARKRADEIMREICIEDGMNKTRAWAAYRFVRQFGAKSARPNVLTAP